MTVLTERFELRLDEDTIARIDRWRFARGGSRAEAIRQLVDSGLETAAKPPIRFSHGETLTIYMLCEIMKGLKLRENELDPQFIEEALLGGHLWGLSWKMSGVFHDHNDSEQVVTQVVNTLGMWSVVEESYEDLDAAQKKRIKELALGPPKYEGYDGNNEHEYLGVAHFLTGRLGRFDRFEKRGALNSHAPMVQVYNRMLKVYEPIRDKLVGSLLSEAQLIKIFEARVHPTNRK